jgi:hypothetical protein
VLGRKRKIPPEAVAEAAKKPGGWVYAMDAPEDFDYVPPERIEGAWKVDEHGQITGEFEKNPNYVPRWRRFVHRSRTGSL